MLRPPRERGPGGEKSRLSRAPRKPVGGYRRHTLRSHGQHEGRVMNQRPIIPNSDDCEPVVLTLANAAATRFDRAAVTSHVEMLHQLAAGASIPGVVILASFIGRDSSPTIERFN